MMASFLIPILITAILVDFPAISGQLEFIDSPASATVLANFPTTLSCTVHPAPSSVSWEKDGFPVAEDGQRLSITLDSSTRARGRSELRVGSVLYSDAGSYLCRASDQSSNVQITSLPAVITVQGIPAFTVPLAPMIVPLGGTALLDCQVLSNPAANITWFYELGPIRRNLITGGRVIISPSNQLTILNVEEGDAGYYVCSAQNIFGRNMTSGRLQIGTPAAPFQVSITPSEADPLIVREGGSVTLRCTVPPTTTISSISWSRMGSALTTVTQISSGLLLSFTSVGKDDAGLYSCTATDIAGTNASQSIEIAVSTPPEFIDEPADVVGMAGQPLQEALVCTAEADPPATITWLSPDSMPLPVDPLTSAPRFPSLARSDEGMYTCLAANSVGEIRSQFTITVQGPPLVSVTSLATPPGQDVVLQCSVSGFPPISDLSWSRIGASLPPSSLTSNVSLYLFSVSSSDAGTYQCTATNSLGITSAQLVLTVLANPRITSSTPSPVVIPTSSTLTLSCVSSGPAETVLTWYHNDTRLDPLNNSNVLVAADGTLTVNNANISNTGVYTCNVSTSFTFVLSHVDVIVGDTPVIVTPPRDVDLTPGTRTLLDCQVGGFPTPHSTWFRTDLVSGQRVELGIVGPSHTQLLMGLELHDVNGSDSGMYECVAENALGVSMQQAIIRVEGAPVATSIQPTVFPTNTNATLTCSTPLNFPMGTISWTSPSGAPLSPSRFTVDEAGVLTISPVLLEDANGVTCRVTNRYGQSSITAAFQVLFPPTVNVTAPSGDIILGGMAVLACTVRGEPIPVLTWTLPDGSDARDGNNTVVDTNTGNLTIFSAGGQNTGTYTCTATNPLGSSSVDIEITIRGEAVPDLTGTVGTTSLRVEWGELSFLAQADLQSFELEIRREGRADPVVERSLSFFIRAFTSTELSPGLTYEVQLMGIYSGGVLGIPSIVRLTTLEEAPTGPPLNLEASPLENGIYLEWELPHEDERNGVISSYTIEYRQTPPANNPEAPYQMESVTPRTDNETTNYTLLNLNGGRSYDVRVIAFTAVGAGPPSTIVTVVTLQAPIGATVGIGVGVALGGVALIIAVVVTMYLVCLLYRRKTRAGKHEPLVAEERGRKKDEKERKKKTVSGPIPDITPQIDYSVHGKFKVQGENGNSINLKPKIITAEDVARPPTKGGSVQRVPRSNTVLAPSNDESDQGRIDPYSMPADAVKRSGGCVPRRQKSSSPVEIRNRVSSGVYSEVSDVMRTPPTGEAEVGGGTEDDKPYEEVEHGNADMWGRGAEEESDGSQDSFDKNPRYTSSPSHPKGTSSPEHPEGPDLNSDSSQLLYASVSQSHVDKKREKRLREQQREEEEKQVRESKQNKKMQEKMERERLKMEEKERKRKEKEEQKERKKLEAEYKKKAKETKQRESMGLSNIVTYQDIDFNKPGSRAQAEFIDSATAALF